MPLERSQPADGAQGLVRSLDALAVELERPLGLDEVHQLGHGIDVGPFEESLLNAAQSVRERIADDRFAGRSRGVWAGA